MIINKTNGKVIADYFYLANNPFKRMRGLLGFKKLDNGTAMVIRPCNCVHSFFMRFPIDLLFVDRDNKIVGILIGMPPFRLSPILFQSKYVVELPAGTIERLNISKGDQLELT